jgi:hypothetical protein
MNTIGLKGIEFDEKGRMKSAYGSFTKSQLHSHTTSKYFSTPPKTNIKTFTGVPKFK